MRRTDPEHTAQIAERAFYTGPTTDTNSSPGSVSGMVIAGIRNDRQAWTGSPKQVAEYSLPPIDLRLWIHRNHRIPLTLDENRIDPLPLQIPSPRTNAAPAPRRTMACSAWVGG